jgi:maltose O-acetyltransferase
MTTEKEKMVSGELYNSMDNELVADRMKAAALCQQLNALAVSMPSLERQAILWKLFDYETNANVTTPFYCDYGYNIKLGDKVYFNFNCVILDVATVTIGNNTLFGPAVQIYTALHPMVADERRKGLESGKPVVIGDDVWIGGAAIICPGVTIGSGSVIGAGSVVTRDVPKNVFAAGNPCRVIRKL